jgi:hypothetical protein
MTMAPPSALVFRLYAETLDGFVRQDQQVTPITLIDLLCGFNIFIMSAIRASCQANRGDQDYYQSKPKISVLHIISSDFTLLNL